MTDEKENTEPSSAEDVAEKPPVGKQGMDPVRKWTFLLLGLALVLTIIYLRADRITPYTTQAKIHA